MSEKKNLEQENLTEDVAENSGSRTAAIKNNPQIGLEEARNASEGKKPNAAGGGAPSTVEDHVPSSSDPNPSDLPSTDHPRP